MRATLVIRGAAAFCSSSHFAALRYEVVSKPGNIADRSRDAARQAGFDRIAATHEDNRDGVGGSLRCPACRPPKRNNHLRMEVHQCIRIRCKVGAIRTAKIDLEIASFDPTELRHSLAKRLNCATHRQHTNSAHALCLLRRRRERPRRAAEKRDELAPVASR
jgi:hypothetical protein